MIKKTTTTKKTKKLDDSRVKNAEEELDNLPPLESGEEIEREIDEKF